MKKVLTAILNEKIFNEIKSDTIVPVSEDIQYQEALIEIIEKEPNIDFLLLNCYIPGEKNIFKIIEKIKEINYRIKIIVFIEKKDEKIKNILYSKGVFYVFIDEEIDIRKIKGLILDEDREKEEIREELEKLRKIVFENSINKRNEENNRFITFNFKKLKKNNITIPKYKKVISISGSYGTGKSTFASIISKEISKNNKTLLIDFDILNKSISTIFEVKDKKTGEELIISKNKNLDLICNVNILFNSKNKIDNQKVHNLFKDLKEKYDYIIIDNSSEVFLKYTKTILENSDIIVFLADPSLIEIKKSEKMLDIYIKEWHIQKDKITIILNKINNKFLLINSIKKTLKNIEIIGKIKFKNNYNLMLENKLKKFVFYKIKEKQYKRIIEKII